MKTFSEKLKAERKRIGITQLEAAGILGVSDRVLWDWESGRVEPMEITMEGALARLSLVKSERKKKIAESAK